MGKAVYVQPGEAINYKNTGADPILYGDVVVLAERIGVAAIDIEPGQLGTVNVAKVYELDAETTAAFAIGQTVYWDTAKKLLTATKAANPIVAGWVTEAKAQAGARARVKL